MMHNYNSFQLIKFIYGEGFITDILEVEHAIENNAAIREEYEALKSAKALLPNVSFHPSTHIVDNILQYSKMSLQFN